MDRKLEAITFSSIVLVCEPSPNSSRSTATTPPQSPSTDISWTSRPAIPIARGSKLQSLTTYGKSTVRILNYQKHLLVKPRSICWSTTGPKTANLKSFSWHVGNRRASHAADG